MTVAVIDYGIGNLHSAQKALRTLGADAVLTDSADVITSAAAVVLPGVGNFGACMNALRQRDLDGVVHDVVDSGRPFLGICVAALSYLPHDFDAFTRLTKLSASLV